MPSTIDTINALINANVDNYPNKAFQNSALKTILLLMTSQLTGGGGGSTFAGPFEITSSNFTTATVCPIPLLDGLNIIVYLNGVGYLKKGTDWQDHAGGGFEVLLSGFNSATTNVNDVFYVSLKGN